jgi:phage terminase small subunit
VSLSPKQNAFVGHYLVCLNATEAALRAGYSAKTAGAMGSENLKKPEIQKAIEEALARRAQRVEVTQDDVLRVLYRNLTFDPASLYDAKGALLAVHEMPKEARLAIQSIEHGELGPKVKFWSKDKALELSMRHLGMLKDKVELSVTKTFADLVLESMKPEGEKQ